MTALDRAERILTEMCSLVDELSRLESGAAPPQRVQDNRKKLSQREVGLIRTMHRNGVKVTEIARVFDVHHSNISRTVRGIQHR